MRRELHRWGQGNQVVFDPAKETCCILSQTDPEGENLRLLGVPFDTKLLMADCVHECVHEAGWRLKSILRTRRFHTDSELIHHFKSHVLSFLEYRTAALYHASSTILQQLDGILRG